MARILVFYQYFSTPRGSWGTRHYEFARRWVSAGHKVTIVTSIYDKSDLEATGYITRIDVEGIDVIAINLRLSNKHDPLRRLWTFFAYSAISCWFALTIRCDKVIASSGPITVGIPGLLAHWLRRKPLIFEVRDLWPEGAIQLGMLSGTISRWLARTLEGLCYRNSETVVALSPGMARGITHRTPNAHVITIPNAADLDLFTPTLHIPKAIADFAKGKFLVVYAGTLGRANGTMELIEIADEVSRRPSPAIHFLILGDGADRTHMQSSANQRNLTNITFLGIRPKTEIAQWYAAADVTLCLFKPLPVLATTSPNKLFDSLAAGRPVLNNTDGWIKDLLERTGAGITVPGSSAAAAADALCRLQRDPDLLRSMGRNARSAAESHFARSDLAAMYATLFTATPPVPPNHASNSSSI